MGRPVAMSSQAGILGRRLIAPARSDHEKSKQLSLAVCSKLEASRVASLASQPPSLKWGPYLPLESLVGSSGKFLC